MTQSTPFAQVATNQFDYLSSALCANTPPCKKHSSSRKFLTSSISLRLLLVMFLTLTVSAEVWAETITDEITASDLKATSTTYTAFSNVSKSSDAIYAGQSAKDNSGNIQLRSKNSNSGIVSTTSGGKVKSVKITVGSGSNTIDVYGSNTAYTGATDLYDNNNQGTKIGSVTSTGTITFAEDYTYVGIRSNSGAIYLSKIDIEWESASAAPSYIVTATSNNDSYGTVSVSGTTITATPKDGYRVKSGDAGYTVTSGTADVTNNGDNTFSVTPSSDCTITINFEAIPKYTVTWNVNGEVYETTQVTEGSKLTFPATPSSCDATSNTFYGWATAIWDGKINDINGKIIYTSANEMPEVNGTVTYHAVFAKKGTSGSGTASWNKVTSTADLEAGAIYAISNAATEGNYLSTYTGGNNFPNSTTTICKLVLGGSEDAWTFKINDASSYNNYYLTATSTTGSNYLKATSTIDDYCKFSISFANNGNAVITCTGKSSRNILRYNSSNTPPIFACYSSGQNDVYLQKYSTGSTTTHSDYITSCSPQPTQLATPNVTLDSYDCTSATITWDAITNASGYWYQIKKIDEIEGAISSPNTTYTRNDLEPGTSYTWSVQAIGDDNAYLDSEIATGTFTTDQAIWKLVTDKSQVSVGDKIVIAATNYKYALSTTQNDANRGQAEIDKKYNTITTFSEDVQVLTIEAGTSNGTFAFYTGSGYLYAASSSANQLKTQANKGNANWTVSINDNSEARIVCEGTATHNVLRYNNTSQLFSCYLSTSNQKSISIYKKVCIQDQYNVNEPKLTNATAANTNPTTVDADATSLTLNYSANTGYLLPETITVKMGGVELVSGTDYTWNRETGTLAITVTGFYGDIDVKIVAEEDPCYTFAMSEVTATSTTNSITLTWTEVAGATGYNVRLDEGEFTTATGLTHTFEGLSPKTPYTWEVQAVKDGANFHCEASKTGCTTTQKETFTVSWSVNGTVTSTESVVDGEPIKNTPSTPSDQTLEDCGANKFMGWSEKSAGSTPQDAAYYDDLCSAADMKSKYTSVTGDKTFYALFATATTTPGTSITQEETYSHTITSKTWDATGAKTLTNVSWTLANNGDYYGYDGTKGQQVGSGSKPAKSMTLTTSGFASASKITNVTINTSGASDTNAKVSVKVGGTSYSCNSNTTPAISTSATDYQFTGNSTGEIVISWSQTSSKAIYFKSITVEYSNTTTTPDVTTYSNYVTNCCALAPATILTVSGTTSNTATLTWTAPSPTTGITKLQVRNADNDAVVVDNIAVGTTTATITGLTECTKYNYYVVSVGDCEVFSNTVTAQPFSNAKTVNYDYNGGSGSPASFTTSCENQVITLPTATRAGYDFNGWYTAATGGTKVGDAGGTYDPTISSITLYAQWTKKIYIISFHANGGEGTMANQSADENDVVAQLNANQFTREGYAFVGWNTTAGGTGTAYADQATNIMLTQNRTLYAQWAAIVTLNDAGNVTTTHPAIAGGSITLEDGANACDPYEFVGWTSVATADWNEGINEPALVATTYTPNAPTTLYAVYKIQSEGNANAFKLSFEGGNGKTYYVGSYNSSPYLRGYSNITEEEAVTFIRTKMYPNDDTRYYLHMEHKGEYLYYTGSLNSTSSTPSESQGWVFHTVGDKIKLQSTYSYDPDYLSFSDRDQETINISTSTSGSEFNMLSAVTSTYVASPLCNQEIEIIFETGNGDFVDNAPATNPLTVSRGDVITLPTCEYPGYEFMGWMKDEQQLDPSDIIGTYYTGDYTVDGVSSTITFYAYYKAIPEEVEFTGKDDVELLMYYYDGTENYYYAVSHAAERGELSSKQNCFNATTWTFTNVGNMQYHIQDETGKYLGAYSDGDNDLILSATPKVWTFTEVNGLWKMVCENSPSRALMYISEGNRFTNAAITNEGNGAYSYVTLGICPYPTYTTNPVLTQGFIVTNTAMVTSAFGQNIKAANALTLETRNIELPCTFTITAPNITFYDNTGAEVTQLTASAASEQFELHFAYQPTAENTMEYPTITITDDEMKTYTIKNRIYARSLPNTFAVVAKVGGIWYALPSQGLNSTDALVGYPIEVDNIADPTAVTAVPENADWSLRQVYASSRDLDRFKTGGHNLVFVNNVSPEKALNPSSSSNYLLTNAQYNNYHNATTPGLYEWTPTTTDLETYQLTNVSRTDKQLNIATNTVFGVHATEVVTADVRFLPIQNRYIPAALQVVEWKENSVVIMYNGDPEQTASVSVNGADAQNTTLSAPESQRDIAVYELTADGLAANPTQQLSITIGTEKTILSIPYIISGSKNDIDVLPGSTVAARQEVAKVSDLVILKGATLTAAGAKGNPYKFRNVTVYGGGKLVVPADNGFGVNSLTLRIGGVTADRNYDYVYPEFVLNTQYDGAYTNTSGKINLDYVTTKEQYYTFVAPFAVNTQDIKYPVDIYGNNVAAANKGSFEFQYYDGAERADGNTGWVVVNEDPNGDGEYEGATLTAGQGYTFLGMPKKVSVNGGTSTRQKFGIHRIPMTVAAGTAMTHENSVQSITVAPHPSEKNNNSGWNLIGNPYMTIITGLTNEDIQVGKLVYINDAQGNWTGKWQWDEETVKNNQRFLVIPSNDGQSFESVQASNATLPAFKNFFVQVRNESANALSIPRTTPAAQLLVPARRTEELVKDVEVAIVLEQDEEHTDQMDFLINNIYTEDFERDADFTKMMNATNLNLYGVHPYDNLSFVAIDNNTARGSVAIGYQVPQAGEYTLRMSDKPYVMFDKIEALYVTDHAMSPELTVDLMNAPYEFSVNQAETNNERFTISLILESENQGPTTGWENIDVGKDQSIKFIYLDQLYILRNGIIYDATGQQIKTINK